MISLNAKNEIKKSLSFHATDSFDFDKVRETMLSVSSKLTILSESLMVHALLRHCMSVGSRVFAKDKKVQALATRYLDYLDRNILIDNEYDLDYFKHSTMVAMELISAHDASVTTDLLPKELRLECDHLAAKSEPITPVQFDDWFAASMQTFDVVEGLPNVATSLGSAVTFLRGRLETGCVESGKALRYLIENNDVLPDDLGLFGMADDIYVLERAALKLGGFKTGENLLFEFEGYSSSIKGLLLEEDGKLVPLSLATRLMLSSMNFLIESDKKRFVFALPEPGPSGLLALLYLFFEAPNKAKSEFTFPIVGTNIYFPVWNGYVEAKYLGEKIVASEKFHVVSFDDAGNSSKYMRRDQFRNCVIEPRQNRRIFNDQHHLQQNTDVEVSALFDGVKRKTADMPFIIFLTQKNRFLHFFNEISPFGESLSTIFDVRYHTRTGSVDEFGRGDNEINVFSDAESAREFFMKNIEKNPTVICDVADLGEHFLEQLGGLALDQAKNLIFFFSDSEKTPLETCRRNEFVFCCHGSAYADFPMVRHSLEGKQSIGSFEKKLVTSYLRPVIERLEFESELVDRFLDLSYLVKKSSSAAGEAYIVSKIGLVSRSTIASVIPLCENERQKCADHMSELAEWLEMLDRDDADNLINFLDENRDALLNLPSDRNLVGTIKEHSVEAVFARSTPELKRLNAYLASHNILSVETCSLTALGMKSYDGNLLVPVMPASGSQTRFLCQTKISERLLLNFTTLEEKMFNRLVSQAVKWQTALECANRQTFKNTRTIRRMPPEAEFDFAQALKEKIDEVDNTLLNSIRNDARQNANSSSNAVRDVAVACVHQVAGENKVVFFPPRARVICIDEIESKFIEKSVKSILEGDIVLLRLGGKGDPYDEICSLTYPEEFSDTKKWAVRWRERLRKYSLSNDLHLESLQQRLVETGLKRGIPTIKGWLQNSATVAPADPKESIKAIYALPFNGYPESEVEHVLAAIDKIYSMRRDASEELLKYLGRENPADFLDAEEVAIRLPTSEFVMRVVHLGEPLGEIEVPASSLWDVQELDRGMDAG